MAKRRRFRLSVRAMSTSFRAYQSCSGRSGRYGGPCIAGLVVIVSHVLLFYAPETTWYALPVRVCTRLLSWCACSCQVARATKDAKWLGLLPSARQHRVRVSGCLRRCATSWRMAARWRPFRSAALQLAPTDDAVVAPPGAGHWV